MLASAPLADGRWAVATTRALHVAGAAAGAEVAAEPSGAGADERHGWDEVATATWSDTASMLQVTWADGSRALAVEFAGSAGYLPEVVRERVEASVVLTRRIEVTGRRGVRVAVRREAPGAALTTQVVADRGVDVREPELAARIAAEVETLREQTGL